MIRPWPRQSLRSWRTRCEPRSGWRRRLTLSRAQAVNKPPLSTHKEPRRVSVMKTWRWASILAVALLLFTPLPGHAGPRVFVDIGPAWPAPWYYPAPTYVYTPPPTVLVQPARAYVVPPPQRYWYFCQSFNAYYPQAQI